MRGDNFKSNLHEAVKDDRGRTTKYFLESLYLYFFGMCHLYYYLTENEDHSRMSSFEEGAPDVGQIEARVLILDEAKAAHCRSPFKA